jgi:hypothetical protein
MSFLINPFIYEPVGCPANLIDATSQMLYYKFNSDTTDSSGNGDNLSMSGTASYAAGKFGNAIDLSGTNNFGYLPNSSYSVNGIGDISWGAWLRTDVTASTYVAMSKYANNSGFGMGVDVGKFYTFFNANTTYYEINTAVFTAKIGVWNHLVATRKASTGQFFLYLNGTYITSGSTNTSNMTNVTEDYRVGTQKVTTTLQRFWNGLIDEAFVYHRTLTASEISTIYSSTCPIKT